MSALTTSDAPPDAAPEMTLIRVPFEVCQALIVGFGPTYAASSWPASSAVASSVPVAKGTSLSCTLPPRFLEKKPFSAPISAGACVMLVRKPSRRTIGLPDPPLPDGLAWDEAQPAASRAAAATAAAVTARFIEAPIPI